MVLEALEEFLICVQKFTKNTEKYKETDENDLNVANCTKNIANDSHTSRSESKPLGSSVLSNKSTLGKTLPTDKSSLLTGIDKNIPQEQIDVSEDSNCSHVNVKSINVLPNSSDKESAQEITDIPSLTKTDNAGEFQIHSNYLP